MLHVLISSMLWIIMCSRTFEGFVCMRILEMLGLKMVFLTNFMSTIDWLFVEIDCMLEDGWFSRKFQASNRLMQRDNRFSSSNFPISFYRMHISIVCCTRTIVCCTRTIDWSYRILSVQSIDVGRQSIDAIKFSNFVL